jgi:hypothetical protein
VLTKDTNLAAMYNAQSYPIYVVIDRDGNTAAEQRGAAGEAALGGAGRTGIEVGVGGLKINATTNLAAKCSPMAIWRKYGKMKWCSSYDDLSQLTQPTQLSRLFHSNRLSPQNHAVQVCDSLLGFEVVGHFHKREPT